MIKMWQCLQYLLNCWSFCYQTCFASTLSSTRVFYGEVGLICSKSRSQQNVKMSLNVCLHDSSETLNFLLSSETLNFLLPNMVWWCNIMSQIVFQKDWFVVFKVKVTGKDNIIKINLLNILSELLIFLQLNLALWHIIIRRRFLRKDWIALLWSRSKSKKVQTSCEFSSGRYLLNCWTFCNQTR